MKFSITIPAYKALFLREAIASVLCQTYRDFELVIVDDCSPEDLRSVVDGFEDPRIKYFRNEKNCGAADVACNWDVCLSYCAGDYVICMGDDDRLLPGCLEEYDKLMAKYPGLAVYHAWAEIIDDDGQFVALTQPRPDYESALSLMIHRWGGREQFIGDFCYDTKALKEAGGYYKMPLAWASDDITAVRAAMEKGVANMQVPGFQYRKNAATITRQGDPDIKLKAAFREREWYLQLQAAIKEGELSDVDKKYYAMMGEALQCHFHRQRKVCLIAGMDGSLKRLMTYIRHRKELEISGSLLLYYWTESMVHKR